MMAVEKPILEPAAIGKTATDLWQGRRDRAETLIGRYDFAAQLLGFYSKLTLAQEQIWQRSHAEQPDPLALAQWVTTNEGLALVSNVARNNGPALLAESVAAFEQASSTIQQEALHAYLVDIPMPEVEGCSRAAALFVARATLGPALEALDLEAKVTTALTGEERRCPWCWALPQCKTLAESGQYTSSCQLVCSRCARSWEFARRKCASCGEERLNQLAIFEASEVLPHLRVDGCRTCNTYLVTVDQRKDGKALPLVDELCALPLDLWAAEQGFSKAHPNLLGV